MFLLRPISLAALALCSQQTVFAQTSSTESEAALQTVTVEASADASAQGLAKPFAGGQVARGARVGVLGNRDMMETPFSATSYTSDLIQDNSLLGGDMATQHLIDKGHTRIACITGPLDKNTAQERLSGYRQAMEKAGLKILPGYEVCSDFEFEGGLAAMQQLLALSESTLNQPDANTLASYGSTASFTVEGGAAEVLGLDLYA